MWISPIQPYASEHPEYAVRFATELTALTEAETASKAAAAALAEAQAAKKAAHADRLAGKRAMSAEQADHRVAQAKAAATRALARNETARAALSKAVNSDGAFMATAALDHLRTVVAALDDAFALAESFFGGVGRSGSIDHAAQVVQLPPARHAIGRRVADPTQRADAVALLRATVDSMKERLAQVDTAQPPAPVAEVPMTDFRLHGRTDVSNGAMGRSF